MLAGSRSATDPAIDYVSVETAEGEGPAGSGRPRLHWHRREARGAGIPLFDCPRIDDERATFEQPTRFDATKLLEAIQAAPASAPHFSLFLADSPRLLWGMIQPCPPDDFTALLRAYRLCEGLLAWFDPGRLTEKTRSSWLALLRLRFELLVRLDGLKSLAFPKPLPQYPEDPLTSYVENPKDRLVRAAIAWYEALVNPDYEMHVATALNVAHRRWRAEREAAVRRIVWQGGDPKRGLRSAYCVPHGRGQTFLNRILRHWFLQIYDLPGARQLAQSLTSGPGAPIGRWDRLYFSGWFPFVVPAVLLSVVMGAAVVGALSPHVWWIALVLLVMAVGSFLVLIFLTVHRSILYLSLLIPRLAAGAIVGLFVVAPVKDLLESAEKSWDILPLATGALFTFCFTVAFVYLFAEVHNSPGDPGASVKRVSRLAVLGLLQALAVTTIGIWFLRPFMLRGSDRDWTAAAWLPDLVSWGLVQSMLVLGPLAFLIGIFAQIFWEDKAVTEPL